MKGNGKRLLELCSTFGPVIARTFLSKDQIGPRWRGCTTPILVMPATSRECPLTSAPRSQAVQQISLYSRGVKRKFTMGQNKKIELRQGRDWPYS